ncbi:hypothetical protein MLAC_36690 [Mycobacterium lacus]|uniref:Transposase DDE domain-containing protein n=1 Tax=Mycobacterium lacus TaxID=169765 RepID=A0A7I7NNY1_9MYCO|nr:hypothetical protein MLAC_36690 [Mycobacterium lacus]
MNGSAAGPRVKVSADGAGVVSHAGVGMLREVADLTGLSSQVTAVLADTYRGPWMHAPGVVFADLAAAVADGADCIDSVGALWGDRQQAFGPVASTSTLWRLVDERIDAAHLPGIRAARAHARAQAWAAGAAPEHGGWLHLDVDATICVDHSDNKENAAATWKKTFGFHPLLVFLDRPDIAAGEALAGLLRAGNAGSNTTADHITVLEQALESLPAAYRPDPDNPDGPAVLIRSDSAGATYGFAAACRTAHVGFSLGAVIDSRVQNAVEILNDADAWYPAIDTDGAIRDGAWSPRPPIWWICRLGRPARGWSYARSARTPAPSCGSPILTATGSPGFSPTPPTGPSPASWPAWSCATANTPGWKTASAKPKPPACGIYRSVLLTPMPPGLKSSWQPPI